MVQRDHHVVNDLLGRHGQAVILQSGQVITRKLIVDGAIVCHKRPHPAGIQDVQRGEDAALIALLQDVGVAMYQLAGHPIRDELDRFW
jgi:hypothetical protein